MLFSVLTDIPVKKFLVKTCWKKIPTQTIFSFLASMPQNTKCKAWDPNV